MLFEHGNLKRNYHHNNTRTIFNMTCTNYLTKQPLFPLVPLACSSQTMQNNAEHALNSLPDDKILDWSKLKQIADDILNLTKWQQVIQKGRKHYGKGRNCSLRAISLFPTVFSEGLFPRGVKRCHCVGMGKTSLGKKDTTYLSSSEQLLGFGFESGEVLRSWKILAILNTSIFFHNVFLTISVKKIVNQGPYGLAN